MEKLKIITGNKSLEIGERILGIDSDGSGGGNLGVWVCPLVGSSSLYPTSGRSHEFSYIFVFPSEAYNDANFLSFYSVLNR